MKWCTLGPLVYEGANDLQVPFELGQDVALVALPSWAKQDLIVENLGFDWRRRLLENIRYALATEYASSSLGEADGDWDPKGTMSKQDHARHRICISNLAIWLAKPSSLRFGILIHAQQDDDAVWTLRDLSPLPELVPHEKDQHNRLTGADLHVARQMYAGIIGLRMRGPVWLAARALWMALCGRVWEIRYTLYWIGLEALFGPEDPREMTYRISQRIAFFLSEDVGRAQDLFRQMKDAYSLRSKVVHGMLVSKSRGWNEESSQALAYGTEDVLSRALNKILQDKGLVGIFTGKRRETWLDDLAFSTRF